MQTPRGGGRFALAHVRVDGVPGVEKRGDTAALSREAAAVEAVHGLGVAPRLLRRGPGVLVTALAPGSVRHAADVGDGGWRSLGALLAHLHAATSASEGRDVSGRPHRDPASLAEARRSEARDAARAAGIVADVPLPDCATPFARIHGDLLAGNIVWSGERPMLIDWEYSRVADPAEDLAYVAVLNHLGPSARAALADGYGDPETWRRAASWEPVVRSEGAAWWTLHGEQGRADLLMADAAPGAAEGAGR